MGLQIARAEYYWRMWYCFPYWTANYATTQFNTNSDGSVGVWESKLAITVPTDIPAPNCARTSAGTVLPTMLVMLTVKFRWLSMFRIRFLIKDISKWPISSCELIQQNRYGANVTMLMKQRFVGLYTAQLFKENLVYRLSTRYIAVIYNKITHTEQQLQ